MSTPATPARQERTPRGGGMFRALAHRNFRLFFAGAFLSNAGTGMSLVVFFALGNTLVQQLVSDEMRGRVLSMWLLTIIGTMPVGAFVSGAAADRFGPRPTLAACGLVVLLCGLAAAFLNPRLREL